MSDEPVFLNSLEYIQRKIKDILQKVSQKKDEKKA